MCFLKCYEHIYMLSAYLLNQTDNYFLYLQIYASYKLRTYLMGYPYDSEEDAYEDTAFQKKMMKLSL